MQAGKEESMKNSKKFQVVLALTILLIGLMAALSPLTASAATVNNCKQWHTVQSGEYLVLIAKTYNVDWRDIAEINNIVNPYVIYPGQKICISASSTGTDTTKGSAKVYATSVKEDTKVTLQGKSLTPLSKYTIYFSNEKKANASLLKIGSITTDKAGAFKATFNIPTTLHDISKIRVTLKNSSGASTSNWFFNADLDGNTGGREMPALTVSFESSMRNRWVKVKVNNLLANITYNVYIGEPGKTGFLVGTVVAPEGGSTSATFNIPRELKRVPTLFLEVEHEAFQLSTSLTFDNKTK